MKVCVFVAGIVDAVTPAFLELVASSARMHALEGYVARSTNGEQSFRIIVCGTREKLDLFLDEFHALGVQHDLGDVEISPFINDKDYRGAFRVMI